ncbi:SLOG family protein [Candidatus Soleaferrea massiliensis]|uniref:SLOG family protein n=1 Tax=Candidatus Soleaferrea massiliensis TaxID=1470354 RepID=UPI0005912584|nr:SLOG family protein [Candidatus Soleaferrea massiliensis]
MKSLTCAFSGHRNIPTIKLPAIQKHLEEEIVHLIHQGVLYFIAGGALGFDTLCAITVLRLKGSFPKIKLLLALPCKNQAEKWNKADAEIYQNILNRADRIIYTSHDYSRGCMHRRNRYMADHSDYMICYLTQQTGGTKYTVDYAVSKGVNVINIYESINQS